MATESQEQWNSPSVINELKKKNSVHKKVQAKYPGVYDYIYIYILISVGKKIF